MKITAGVDEVGRGSLIGPVYAAAVILNTSINKKILKDSKGLSKTKREILSKYIKKNSLWSIGKASIKEIEKINILQASLLRLTIAKNRLVDPGRGPGGGAAPAVPGPDRASWTLAAWWRCSSSTRTAKMWTIVRNMMGTPASHCRCSRRAKQNQPSFFGGFFDEIISTSTSNPPWIHPTTNTAGRFDSMLKHTRMDGVHVLMCGWNRTMNHTAESYMDESCTGPDRTRGTRC